MFNNELETKITDSIVRLDERVEALETKETLTVGDAVGPFKHELHVDLFGRGGFTSIKSACDYVAAQPSVGVDEWIIWVHAGFYTENAFTVPDFVTISGIGNVFITSPSFFLTTSLITAGEFVTLRGLRGSESFSSDTEAAFFVDAQQGLRLEECNFRVSFQGPSQGDVHPMGVVRVAGGGNDFFGCQLIALNQTDAEWFVVLIDATDSNSPSYIRSCRIWLDPAGIYFSNSTSVYFIGDGEELFLLETTILGRDSGDPGFDLIADTGATIWLRATNYNKGQGTISYMYAAGAGTVTSVDVDVPDFMTTSGGPVTSSGTITLGLAEQEANLFFAGPASGDPDAPTFRTIEVDDVPLLPPSKIDGGVVLGTGVADRMARWADTDTIEESTVLYDNGSRIWAYTTLPKAFPIAGFTLAHGSPNTGGGGPSAQIAFEFEGSSGGGYSHFIKSRHNGDVTGLQNEILFYINNSNTATGSSAPGTGNRLTLRLSAFDGATIGDPSGTALDLRVTGNTQLDGDLTIAGAFSPASVDTGTGAGNTLLFRAYDVDAAAYINFFTLTANNVPTADLHTDVTIDGDYIYRAGGTDIPIADGGTGASTASDARVNLGLVAGGTGDIWVEKAGDTMTGALVISLATGNSLVVDTTTFVVDATNNRVGIGTASPVTTFHLRIDQSLATDAVFENRDSGNAAQVRFQLRNGATASDALTVGVLGTGFTTNGLFEQDGAYLVAEQFLAGGLYIGTRTDATIRFGTNGFANSNLRMIILGSGEVGVGTATPVSIFDVSSATGGVSTISRADTAIAINDSIGKLQFYGSDSDLSTQNIFGNIEVQALANIGSDVASGKMLLRTTGLGTATAPVERLALGAVKVLTDAATSLFDVTLNAGEMAGGTVVWTIIASNGTDHQAYSGITTYAVVNKAGTYTSQITHNTTNDAKAVSSGTLTATWSVLNGANKVTIRVTPAGSLTETTYQILYSVHSNSPQSIAIL